ncbi:hypothetical protein HaLaN_29214, partial [Haematococcus lacustris]
KNKDGFVVVEKVGEDACHGPYLIVFGHASVLKGSVLVACQRAGLAPLAHRDCVRLRQIASECRTVSGAYREETVYVLTDGNDQSAPATQAALYQAVPGMQNTAGSARATSHWPSNAGTRPAFPMSGPDPDWQQKTRSPPPAIN